MRKSFKRYIKYVWMISVLGMIVGCINGSSDLENKWQMLYCQCADGTTIRQDSVFYNFQKGSFSAICLLPNGEYQTFFGNYSLKAAKISIILLPESVDEENYDTYLGWQEGKRTFTIEELTSSSLRLEYERAKWVFRKY